jgi:ABC-type uncharacterized transport system involved in gliding motility auxiliary subunit
MADRKAIGRKEIKGKLIAGSTLGTGVALVLALVLIINYFGWKYHGRFDWTSSNIYSLSEKSLNILEALDRDVDVTVMLGPQDQAFADARELLARYEGESSHISVRVIDPEKNLTEAQLLVDKFQLDQLNVVVFESGDYRRAIESADLVDMDYSAMQSGGAPTVTGFKGEQLFTSALVELVESEKPRVAFVTGHGEASIDDFSPAGASGLRELLERDNFELEVWSSLGAGSVPEGVDLVILAGSQASLVEPEVEVLRQYLERGGRLLLLVDPTLSQFGGIEPTGLDELLAEYGVVMGENIIVDPGNPLPFFGPETLFLAEYGDHDVVRSMRQDDLQVILPLARSVAKGEVTEGLEVTELFTTSDEGWGETDLENLLAVERGEDDLAGPVPIGVAVRAMLSEGDAVATDSAGGPASEARLIVIGDSNFADNSQIHNASNAVLAANAINWLVERQELVAIPPKTPEQTRLNLSASQLRTITWLVMVMMPGLAIAVGVAIHLRRRR